jgi:hypothetical protein
MRLASAIFFPSIVRRGEQGAGVYKTCEAQCKSSGTRTLGGVHWRPAPCNSWLVSIADRFFPFQSFIINWQVLSPPESMKISAAFWIHCQICGYFQNPRLPDCFRSW